MKKQLNLKCHEEQNIIPGQNQPTAVPLDPSKKFKEKNQQQPSDVIELQMKRKHQRRGLEAKSVKHLPSLLPQRFLKKHLLEHPKLLLKRRK